MLLHVLFSMSGPSPGQLPFDNIKYNQPLVHFCNLSTTWEAFQGAGCSGGTGYLCRSTGDNGDGVGQSVCENTHATGDLNNDTHPCWSSGDWDVECINDLCVGSYLCGGYTVQIGVQDGLNTTDYFLESADISGSVTSDTSNTSNTSDWSCWVIGRRAYVPDANDQTLQAICKASNNEFIRKCHADPVGACVGEYKKCCGPEVREVFDSGCPASDEFTEYTWEPNLPGLGYFARFKDESGELGAYVKATCDQANDYRYPCGTGLDGDVQLGRCKASHCFHPNTTVVARKNGVESTMAIGAVELDDEIGVFDSSSSNPTGFSRVIGWLLRGAPNAPAICIPSAGRKYVQIEYEGGSFHTTPEHTVTFKCEKEDPLSLVQGACLTTARRLVNMRLAGEEILLPVDTITGDGSSSAGWKKVINVELFEDRKLPVIPMTVGPGLFRSDGGALLPRIGMRSETQTCALL